MKFIIATAAALSLLAGAANAASLGLFSGDVSGVSGGTGASANSASGNGALSFGNGIAGGIHTNTTQSQAATGIQVQADDDASGLIGESVAGSTSTSAGGNFSLGSAASAGGAFGFGGASGQSQGFGFGATGGWVVLP